MTREESTLDEAINHAEEVAEDKETRAKECIVKANSNNEWLFDYEVRKLNEESVSCAECAAEHRQLAEWLKELKAYKENACEDAISRQAALDCFTATKLKKFDFVLYAREEIKELPPVTPAENPNKWIPCSERLPETDNKNSINNYNVLLWVKNKSHPEREPQIYLGKLRHIDGDDGSGNFWGIETKPCDWTIWGWCYFNEPEIIAWMPLPEPYKAESEGE